ncbi:DPP IV N-terminal domain-containing protein [Pelomonas sp. SE-A7]|uniref:S9 family peptidase n=1 Tax=Pelomonas sp. SE-A7 TaxID=3054953 RepID=UPI00259CF21A|nr:DPP IV N-terminal domain-containing protein [Pelomonas sp. SE-A7]MDM4765913.1 DPP IV N-terminal domain-containing protein [Pelomonas sp. SE-A7]
MRKHPTLRPLLLAAMLAAAGLPSAAAAAPAEPELTLDRIFADPPLTGRMPRAASVSPAGQWLTFLRPSESDSEVMELWGQPLPAGKPRRLLAMSDLIGQAKAQLTEAEKMALERRRISGSGILSYQWCGEDDKRLLVPMSGALYAVELSGEAAPKSRKLTEGGGEPAREPQCDKAGRQVAFVQGGDLYVQSLAEGAAKRLTQTGSKTVSTGLAEFIAEEELDRHKGFWWSPDGQSLLAIEVDESPVPIKVRAQIFADRTAMTEQRYPGAGQPNAKTRALRIDLADGRITPLPLPSEAEYIARAGWFADGKPWLQWLTRDQTRLDLVEFNGNAARTVLSERDPAWVELHNDLRELPAHKLSGQPALLWSSERSGRRQLWLLDRVSGAIKQLTQQAETVTNVVCAAGQRIVFAGATERGRGQELFETDLNGKTRMIETGQPRRWRSASGDGACKSLLMSESSWGVPATSRVVSLDGKAAPIAVEGGVPDPMLARLVPQQQVLDIISADGKTPLNATYSPPLKPSATGKNPVIVQAYGGPHGASVGWRFSGGMLMEAYWQRLGFGVMTVDTRGMAHRDRDFTHAHYRAIGKIEVADLFAAVRQLPKLVPSVDPARIGFTGWSYGGFLAARSMMDEDTPFAAAYAGAPPTDWTLYDTAYTERYLGVDTQGGKAPAYAEANLIPRAKFLSKPLMLVHGTADDNVLFENSLKLIEALQNEGKIFETTIYPGKAHGIAGRKSRLHAARNQTDFFVRHLKP